MLTGTVDGRIIGHVVEHGDDYIAFDATTAPLGRFTTLPAAREAATATLA